MEDHEVEEEEVTEVAAGEVIEAAGVEVVVVEETEGEVPLEEEEEEEETGGEEVLSEVAEVEGRLKSILFPAESPLPIRRWPKRKMLL